MALSGQRHDIMLNKSLLHVPNHTLKGLHMLMVVGTMVKNLKIYNFVEINFYATSGYVEQGFEIYFSEKISKYIEFVC